MEARFVVFTEVWVVSMNFMAWMMSIVSDISVRVTMRSKLMSRINGMSYFMMAAFMPISAQYIMRASVEIYMLNIFVLNSMMSARFDAVEKIIILVLNVL